MDRELANDLSSLALGEQSMKVIQSSYDHLEDHLKHCLLYMALFPEDHKITVDHLLKLWMAEEFVLNSETENVEEASRNCLSDLLNSSLVMVSGMRINRDIVYCSLHDVVREFCLRKLTQDNYIQVAVPYNPYQHLHSTESRLCIYIHDNLVKQLDDSDYHLDKIPMLDFKETNSLEFIAHPKLNTWNNQYWNPLDLPVKLRFVRALQWMDIALPNSWATAMQSLTQLRRYLALHVRQFKLEWISHLHNLQTLQLKSSKRIRLRAATLWEIEEAKACEYRQFSGEVGLQVEDEPKFPLFPIPEIHTHLHSSSIQLDGSWDVTNVEFPALKYLTLHDMMMNEWKASEESFPVLEKLVIRRGIIKEIPPSFADTPTLKLIELIDCMESVGVSAMNIKRDIEENTGCDSLHVLVVNQK
ncbi:hypothetical protein H5410_033154 [Solanum commersonii]|uniref:Disease resistance protein winged helix domain-containing protein n=1 Tax=Solanum commersonii TaxID=4109 RepID=A0A9J5YPY6_SOLCO|nr:hypothetical protein H5410_033154 [Solanum commersonii]